MIVPAGVKHGFSNSGSGKLHIQSTLAAPVFEAAYDDKRETPRRWLPGHSNPLSRCAGNAPVARGSRVRQSEPSRPADKARARR